jgi:hypothetical protein
MSSRVSGAIVSFALVSIFLLGFFLIIPGSYNRLDLLDLGFQGNATLDSGFDFLLNSQSVFGFMFMLLAAFSIIAVMWYVFGGRR